MLGMKVPDSFANALQQRPPSGVSASCAAKKVSAPEPNIVAAGDVQQALNDGDAHAEANQAHTRGVYMVKTVEKLP